MTSILFFLFFAGIAFLLFFILRKTLKIVFRLIVLGLVLLIGIVGSMVIWFNLDKPKSKNPPVKKSNVKSVR
ncbi:MAG: hypothetical protein KatS3mg006_1144 [Pyrinomonadaceae bacterium]|nr:MAG: hypothetical protein KatS3mg006_1144 [Pyrinomonadaceae bacterium]